MEPITIVFDDKKMKMIRDFVKETAAGRSKDFGAEFHSIDFLCGAMSIYFALGLEDKLPAAWVFRPLSGEDPFTGEDMTKRRNEMELEKRIKLMLSVYYPSHIEQRSGWLAPWGDYYPCGYGKHGDMATLLEDTARKLEEERNLSDGEMQYFFDGWITLNFSIDYEYRKLYSSGRNGTKALTSAQIATLQDIIQSYEDTPFAGAASSALKLYSSVAEDARVHWFEKVH